MTQGGKLTPNLDEGSTKILNLRVLQRIDPFIEEILITAAHVTFYEFNIALSEWSRKDVEGSLFVVKRNSQPRFQFIVMNRRNTDNLVENLLGDFEYEIQVPYLLYRNAAQEVTGIWFYNSRECEDVANLFSRILNAYSKVPPKPSVSSTKSEFEELEPATTTPVMEGSLEPSSIAVSNVSDVPEESRIASLFSGARIFENASNAVIPRQFYQPSAPVALSSLAPNAMHSPMPTIQLPSAPVPASSIPPISFFDNSGTSSTNRAANLVKPSVFSAPSASSALLMPSISSAGPTAVTHPPVNMQRQHGAPFLQPFPPPNPSSALTPGPLSASNSGTFFTRDKVRDALLRLAQNNQFIDMFYQELLNTNN